MYSRNKAFLITIITHSHSHSLNVVAIKDREDLKNLEELASLQSQVKAVRLQDKLGKQDFRGGMKKILKPVTKSLEKTSQDITKTITETSIKNNQAIENLNTKLLETVNDRGK